uniref:Uncharacterized protein n=1 Tax=Oryza nivara TaxID=4536 RepID=A0A0E0I8Q2_ORYNI
MAIFKKDRTAVLFVISLMLWFSLPAKQYIARMDGPINVAAYMAAFFILTTTFHYNLNCANLPKCTEHECVADCHRRGFQVGVGLVHCMDGRPDQCCCVHGGLLHPDDKLTTN